MHASIPKEITEYHEKIMFGLSIRQLLCFAVAILGGAATWFFCAKLLRLPFDLISYVVIAEAAPLMALGFIRKDGQPFEKYASLVIRHRFGRLRLNFTAAPRGSAALDPAVKAAARRERRKSHVRFAEKTHPQYECQRFEVTKKERQRKRKAAQRKIAAARQEYRAAKRGAKKAAAAAGRAEKHLSMPQV
ncbi:MAG: PrgI family protein [Gracilibacteraceae bacterium]|jgi:hypothetical protein|nr:PrgI family protein [Gracilibacteraceae bacterium]